jgi:hypothetical protein
MCAQWLVTHGAAVAGSPALQFAAALLKTGTGTGTSERMPVVSDFKQCAPKRLYTKSDRDRAVEEIASGMPYSFASRLHSVPISTLHNYVMCKQKGKRKRSTPGKPPLLAESDEEELARYIHYRAIANAPISVRMVRVAAAKIAVAREKKFSGPNGLPGKRWFPGFMRRRHPSLTMFVRRHRRVNPLIPDITQMNDWFKNYKETLAHFKINDPSQVYNMDETGMDGRPGRQQRVIGISKDRPPLRAKEFRDHFTVIGCVRADGICLPPYWITKGEGPIDAKVAARMLAGAHSKAHRPLHHLQTEGEEREE